MCNIIAVLAHLPHAGEEASGPMLGAPRVTGASIMIMVCLGTALSGGHHGGNVWTSGLLNGEPEWVHDDFFTNNIPRSGNNVVDEPLNILGVVGSHAVHNCSLQFTVDKITAINLPYPVRMTIVHQVEVIVPDFTGVARLADEALTEHLGKYQIGVVHPRDSGRSRRRVRRIAERDVTPSKPGP
jgi:hypothetical protein